jgi:hypothetical protein
MSPTINLLASSLQAAILDTILGRLALLFLTGAGGDPVAARHAASQMLAAYHPETENELSLAAEIISFAFHALEALSQATDPDVSLNRQLRIRGSAVSLSRESHKSQRKLDQLQKARRAGVSNQPMQAQAAQPEPVRPGIDKALQLIEATREAVPTASRNGRQSWTQGYQQRQAARRIAENLRKNQVNAGLHIAAATTTHGVALAG